MRPRKGTVIKDGTRYKARITLPDGTRPVVQLPEGISEAKAREMATVLTEKAWKENAVKVPGRPVGKTMTDLLDSWLALVEKDPKYAPATRADHRSNAKDIKETFGEKEPQDLSTGILRRWIRRLVDSGLSASRIHRRWCTLGKCIDSAMGEEWIDIPANPCRHPGMKGVLPAVEDPEEIVILSDEQMTRLLRSPRALRYLVARTSGLRDGEIAGLTWDDIKKEAGIWVYDVTKTHALKGGKRKPKTAAGRRLVPVHSAVVRSLNLDGRTFSADPETGDILGGPIFPSRSGDAFRPPSSELLTEDLGEEGYTFHALRRTFTSAMERAGVPDGDQDRLLGHRAKSTRARHYAAADLVRLQAAVELSYDSSWDAYCASSDAPTSPTIPTTSTGASCA